MTPSPTPESPSVFFSDGAVIDTNTIAVASGFCDAPDTATSRLLWQFDDGWASDDMPDDFLISLAFSAARNQLFALGRNGLVATFGGAGVAFTFDAVCGNGQISWIAGVETRGVMCKVAAIGTGVYACGWGTQLYQLASGGWQSFAQGLEHAGRRGFLNMAGTSESDIYAIGMDGTIAHFDGQRWQLEDSPTNLNLFGITIDDGGIVYITGAEGTVIYGRRGLWKMQDNTGTRGNLWSIQSYQGHRFVACQSSPTGLFEHTMGGLLPVDHQLAKPTTHRLQVGAGQLWSIGEYDLLRLDGSTWQRIPCPENETP